MKLRKNALALLLSTSMAVSMIAGNFGSITEAHAKEIETLPAAAYSWDFEDGGADLHGAALLNNAAIVYDEKKGDKVLSLPGGSTSAGSMSLPEGLLGNVGANGAFSISMWVNTSGDTNNYTKYFNASNAPIGSTNSGGNWTWPDFALAAGGGVYDLTLCVGPAQTSSSNASKVNFNKHLTRDQWEYITTTFTEGGDFHVYINGVEIGYTDGVQSDANKRIGEVVTALFGRISEYKYASIGKSYYSSDADFKGMIDDIAFYDVALDAGQVAEIYDEFTVNQTKTDAQITVDMTDKTGDINHGATGFLYGLGEDNVPSVNLMTAIKPSIAEQNAPDGLQHPSGWVIEVAKSFVEAGGSTLQVACPDIYALWPYEFTSMDDYIAELEIMVEKVRNAGLSDVVVYVPFNEPNGNWYSGMTGNNSNNSTHTRFLQDWKKVYDAIKAVDPDALIAGTNMSEYYNSHVERFMTFAVANDCVPDQFTWHVLYNGPYNNFVSHVAHYRALETQYGLEPREIVINEYGTMTDMGVPGRLAKYIGLFEDDKVSACLAYWHLSNNLADLAADQNEPNGAWWLYKWYADMSGQTLRMETSGVSKWNLYGVASVDDNKKVANIVFGGIDGNTNVVFKNIDATSAFKGADKVKVKIESTSYTGLNGAADEHIS